MSSPFVTLAVFARIILHFPLDFSLPAGFSRTHARVYRDNTPTRARTPVFGGTRTPVFGGTRTWIRYAEAANRPVYTALNMFRIDMGSPNYGWFARSQGVCSYCSLGSEEKMGIL
jgi:hypothetical protein